MDINDVIDNALRLRDAGEIDDAVKSLELHIASQGNSLGVVRALTSILFDGGRWAESAGYALTAIQLAPKSQFNSHLFFLSLMNLNRIDEALEEGKRFLEIHKLEPGLAASRPKEEQDDISHYLATIKEIARLHGSPID